jgi:hypothetical protein
MPINEPLLSKGHLKKLLALRKSIGDKLADEVFIKWQAGQEKAQSVVKTDPVADKILNALKPLENDKSVKLGNQGYVIRRAKGKGVSGFVVAKISKS